MNTYYIMASKKGKPSLFFSIVADRLGMVVDQCVDKGYHVGQCADWYFHAQADPTHSEKEHGSKCYMIEQNDHDFILDDSEASS